MNTNFLEKQWSSLSNINDGVRFAKTPDEIRYCVYILDCALNEMFKREGIELIDLSKYNDLFKK
jgi:hypothetical protein